MTFVTNPSSDFIILALYPVKGFESDLAPCLASLSTRLTNLSSTCSFFFWISPFFSFFRFQCVYFLFFISGLLSSHFFIELGIDFFDFFHYRFYSLSYQANGSRDGNVCNHMRGISILIPFGKTCIFNLIQYYEEKFFPSLFSKPIPEIAQCTVIVR